MAQRIIKTLLDDIDGSEASERILFGLDGASYEIDLNAEHANNLRELFTDYIAVARRKGNRPQSMAGPRRAAPKVDTKAVRAWALRQGYDLAERGRIPASIIQDYMDAGAPPSISPEIAPAVTTSKVRESRSAVPSFRKG